MNKKLKVTGILIAVLIIGFGVYLQFSPGGRNLKTEIIDSKPLEIYVGGACTCPPSEGQQLEVINLYRSKGESLDEIKDREKLVECSHVGCSMAKEYRLYP